MPQQRKVRIGDWILDSNLNRIEREGEFVAIEPLAAEVLSYLARNANQVVSVDELTEKLWQRRFVSDSPVYRIVAELRRALEDDAQKPRYIETFRKRGYRLVAPVEWIAEQTEADSAIPTSSKRWLSLTGLRHSKASKLIAFVLFGVLAIAAILQILQNNSAPKEASVAVLPFDDMSADKTNEHYADGITEVLIHQLSQVQNLRVIAKTSSFAFKDTNTDIRKIGEILDVEAILEGSVQISDGQVRIAAQLIDTRTGTHYWSKLYDREDADIFAIQDEIAASVVAALSITLLDHEELPRSASVGTNNFAAYENYLRGIWQLDEATHESLPRAVSKFERAIELDGRYLQARLALADTFEEMNHVGMMTYTESARRGEAIARDVLRLDPLSVEAKVRLARKDFAFNFPTGSGEAERLFQEIYDVAPGNPRTTRELAYFMKWNDRQNEALARLEQAIAVDPLDRELLAAASALGALHHVERLRNVFPDSPSGWSAEAEVRLAQDQYAEAFRLFQIAEEKDTQNPEFPAWLAMILMTVGLIDDAEAAVERAEARGSASPLTGAARIALIYKKGDLQQAGEMALSALRARTYPRAFSLQVWETVALEYSLQANLAADFIEAYSTWYYFSIYKDSTPELPARHLTDATVDTMLGYWIKLGTVPALRAVGETDLADRIVANALRYFNESSDQFKRSETNYELLVRSGNYDGALDTLEALLETNKVDDPTAYVSLDLGYFWWLRYRVPEDVTFRDEPRFQTILAGRAEMLQVERKAIIRLLREK